MWAKRPTKQDTIDNFETFGAMHGLVANAKGCLGWFVSQVFCNSQGKPLRLEPFQHVMLNMLWYKKFPPPFFKKHLYSGEVKC
mgnify:CR=1 FL=1